MTGAERLRTRLARVRMSLGGCRELRRARDELTIFRRPGDRQDGPCFGSWL